MLLEMHSNNEEGVLFDYNPCRLLDTAVQTELIIGILTREFYIINVVSAQNCIHLKNQKNQMLFDCRFKRLQARIARRMSIWVPRGFFSTHVHLVKPYRPNRIQFILVKISSNILTKTALNLNRTQKKSAKIKTRT